MHLLRLPGLIPPDRLQQIAERIMPDLKRQKRAQLVAWGSGWLTVLVANVLLINRYDTWLEFGVVFGMQVAVLLTVLCVAYRVAWNAYGARVAAAMLEHRHCPHCAYDIRGLPVDTEDGAVVCPECGSAWRIDSLTQTPP